jgi:hypothetical protein
MRARRVLPIALLLAMGFALSGCESFDPESWFNPKKPLPGERKAMFPGGVPGVPQGVPQDLVKGYQPPPDNPPEVVTAEPPPKPKPAARPKPAPRQAAAPRPAPSQAQAPEQSAPPPQAAPWPSQPQQSTQGSSPFPPPPGR